MRVYTRTIREDSIVDYCEYEFGSGIISVPLRGRVTLYTIVQFFG